MPIMISCSQKRINVNDQIKPEIADSSQVNFPIKRGINISLWLSQNSDKITEREKYFSERDVEFLSKIGYDHIRLPIDEDNLWDINGVKQIGAFQLLHQAIGWCKKYKLKVILDMHIIRAHSFSNKRNILWEDLAKKEHFVQLWLQLSREFKKYSNNDLAYELLNEPVAGKAAYWNELIAMTLTELRKIEPKRMVVIGSNMWQSPNTFHELVVPPKDNNIIVSFHFYTPQVFTHYKASWMTIGRYEGYVNYPGQAVDSEDLACYDNELIEEVNKFNGYFTRDTLLKLIQEPIQYSKLHGLQLYCGEFGCLPSVHRSARLQWYKDVRYILESNNIAWANWDYKGGFTIFNQQTLSPDENLITVLLGK